MNQFGQTIGTVNSKIKDTAPWGGGGVNFFFDAQYAEVAAGLYYGSGKRDGTAEATYMGVPTIQVLDDDIGVLGINLGVAGKFPIAINESFRAFPLVGIDYSVAVGGTIPPDVAGGIGDLSALWVKFGAGVDWDLTESWFLRPEFLYGIRMENKYEKDVGSEPNAKVESVSGSGVTVKIGIGMKL